MPSAFFLLILNIYFNLKGENMPWRDDNFGGGGQRGYGGLSMVRAWEDRERLMRGAD